MMKENIQKLTFTLTLLLVIAVCVYAQPQSAQAAVDLIEFYIVETPEGNVVKWTTGSEINISGFIMKRAKSRDGFEPLESYEWDIDRIGFIYEGEETDFVPSRGTPSDPMSYEVLDDNVDEGEQYYYMLVEVARNGRIYELGRTPDEFVIPEFNYYFPFISQ